MATTNDHDSSPLGFDPVEVAAAAMASEGAAPDEHDTVITPRPEAPAYTDDVLPSDGGRRARREASEAGRLPLVTPSPLGRLVIPIALVLIAAIGLLAAWTHYQSRSDTTASDVGPALPTGAVSSDESTAPSTSPSVTASSLPSGATTGPVAPGVSASASTSASTSPSASASSKPSTSASPSAKPSASATARPIDRKVPVVVLNATSRPGLANKVAAKLRAEGWTVTSVGNWTRGGIDKTTIYLNGHLNAQATIRKDFPYAKGPILQPLPGMPRLRMIVVVGDDYPA
jgi:hypothetical protein